MTDLIPRDAAIMRVWAAANTNHPDEKEFLSAVAAIRETALREAADAKAFFHGTKTYKPIMRPWRDAILALIGAKKMTAPEHIWAWHHKDAMLDNRQWADNPYARYHLPATEYVRADLAAVPAQVRVKPLVGWVVANGQGDRWRCVWKWETNAEWTDDISKAIKFATRDDAEAFSADDEDAWLIQEVQIPAIEPQPDPRDEVIARLMEALDRIGRGPEDAGCFCGACVQVRSARTALAAANPSYHQNQKGK